MWTKYQFCSTVFISFEIITVVNCSCDVCDVKPLSTFKDKRVTTAVLWTLASMSSRAECASRCVLFPVIKSFGYHDNTGACVAYTMPTTTPESMQYSADVGFNMYSTCAPVDGGVSEWGSWTGGTCNQYTCGPEVTTAMTRHRTCTNPAPDRGGKECVEPLSETANINCGLSICAVNGGVTQWGPWSFSSCTQHCGSENGQKTRSRTCTNPAPSNGGADCTESLSDAGSYDCGLPSCQINTYSLGSCTTTSDCSGSNVVCEKTTCVCDIMFVYSAGSCVQNCGSYGNIFMFFNDKVLNGYNDRIVNNIATIEACANLCITETGFTCKSADYEHIANTCYLSKSQWNQGSAASRASSSSYHMVIRNCA